MIVMEDDTAHELYRTAMMRVLNEGKEVHVRGQDTIELLDVATVIRQPWRRVVLVPGRRWNPWVAMSEMLWVLAGRNDVKALLPYNKRISEFSDDGISLYGAYGDRIYNQIEPLIQRLQADPSDRRAVLSIWQPTDLTKNTADPPCNDMVMFKLRQNSLHMTVLNRSNDLHWGLYAVNLPVFSFLQEYIASRLNIQMGTQTHLSNSLHIYTSISQNWAITRRMHNEMLEPLPGLPHSTPSALTEAVPLDTVRAACHAALDPGPGYTGDIRFMEFASDFLRMKETKFLPRHSYMYKDWMAAAEAYFA